MVLAPDEVVDTSKDIGTTKHDNGIVHRLLVDDSSLWEEKEDENRQREAKG